MAKGAYVSVKLLEALSWILFGFAALLLLILLGTLLGIHSLPISMTMDLIGVAICCALALVCRRLARRFETS